LSTIDGVIVEAVYKWVPGSLGLELVGVGGGDVGGNNQQGLRGNDQQAVPSAVAGVSDSEEDEEHEAGDDQQSRRKRKREQKENKGQEEEKEKEMKIQKT
jgi:hypothetical protein